VIKNIRTEEWYMDSFVGRSQDIAIISGRRRKIILFIVICVACIVVASVIFILLVNSFMNRRYTSYEVTREVPVTGDSFVKYASYDDKVLRYNRDGISALDASGSIIWNGSYNMVSPSADVCGKYVVAADIGGKTLFVYNEEGQGKEVTTDYPIVQASVSASGIIAVLLEQATSNVINIYNPYDVSNRLLVEIPTNVDEGYPVCIDISPEGTNLVAAYVCVTNGKIQSRAAFYDFTDVGKNTNCLVGAKNYDEIVISDVRFLDSDNICIFTDNGFSVWRNAKKPRESYSNTYEEKIKSAFCNNKYVGMVFENSSSTRPYQMKVYDISGKKVLDLGFNNNYNTVRMYSNDEILFNSASECEIFRINGVKKLSCQVNGRVLNFFPAEGINRYYFVMDDKIQEIKLKKQN